MAPPEAASKSAAPGSKSDESGSKPGASASKPKEAKPREPKKEIVVEEYTCPRCKEQRLLKGKTAYGCANYKVCGFKMPFEVMGKKLTNKHMADLLTKGKTGKIKGFNGDAEGRLVLNEQFEIGLE